MKSKDIKAGLTISGTGGRWTDCEYSRKSSPPTYFILTEEKARRLADLLDGKVPDAAEEA